ncbi:major facilitator superfamily MFS_1 [Alloactinosynnema sp. L-07]|uniref:MFS transporter n=1 Tax=Alloactinosynnema sp. L-07 TaxID=1653480 RepID=UPI00065EF6D9|nr:MFS transporter [Alloactinosynnema sp. L-07]CRK59752.1 major facilitator superfamily MFS_1 [Alloactinosynnema sp. L-07]
MFWRYWAAGAISQVGTAVTAVALPLVAVTVLGASAFEVGLVAAASYAAWILIGLPAGVIVRRLPLRGTQVAMDLIRAAAIGSIPLAWWLGELTLVHLVAAALVISLANVVFDVGNATFLPSIVAKDELTARNSLISATHSTTHLGGPGLGGLLVQLLGAVPTLVIDAVSFLVSAALLRKLPSGNAPQPESAPPMRTQIRDGLRFVLRHPVMRPCVLGATSINFVNGALMALVPVFLVRDLGAAPAVVGLLVAFDGVGALIGATLATRLVNAMGSARAILAASAFGAACCLLHPAGAGGWGMVLFALGAAGFSAGVVVFSISTRTHRQVASPPDLLSRVMATVRFVSWGAIPVGALAAGVVSTVIDTRTTLWVFCALAFLAPVALWFSEVRRIRDLLDEPVVV